jgi:hypothetical protein
MACEMLPVLERWSSVCVVRKTSMFAMMWDTAARSREMLPELISTQKPMIFVVFKRHKIDSQRSRN